MQEIVMELIMAFLASMGFAIVFRLRKEFLFSASLGGLLSWGIYLICLAKMRHIFVACLIASAFSALYAEIIARILGAPAVFFFISAVVPLIPGSTLYYTMSSVVQGEWKEAVYYGTLTAQYALAIAAGLSLVWTFWIVITRILQVYRVRVG